MVLQSIGKIPSIIPSQTIMKQLIQQHKTFYQSWLIWFILVGLYLSFNSKAAGSLALNEIHTPVGDIFFRYITWGGDGIFIGIFCFVFFTTNPLQQHCNNFLTQFGRNPTLKKEIKQNKISYL